MLKIFAGQLYFDSNGQYEEVCVLLALSRAHPDAKRIQMDGFVPVDCRTGRFSPFTESKVKILKELMGLRRKGMDYYRTDMGHVLNATPLGEKTYSEMPSWRPPVMSICTFRLMVLITFSAFRSRAIIKDEFGWTSVHLKRVKGERLKKW
jgi:hypothetical protein